MNKIVKILMGRDGLTEMEAREQVQEVREMMAECEYDPIKCEDIIQDELGLEIDYIFYLI